jgi:hypothetical protein
VESSREVKSSRAAVPVLQHRRAIKLRFPRQTPMLTGDCSSSTYICHG